MFLGLAAEEMLEKRATKRTAEGEEDEEAKQGAEEESDSILDDIMFGSDKPAMKIKGEPKGGYKAKRRMSDSKQEDSIANVKKV